VILTFPNNFIISTSLFNFFSNTQCLYTYMRVCVHTLCYFPKIKNYFRQN
jgi:hypothetical protein